MLLYYLKYLFAIRLKPNSENELLRKVLTAIKTKKYFDDSKILFRKSKLIHSNEFIQVNDFGAGSKVENSNVRSISKIAKNASIYAKHGKLLSNIVSNIGADKIIELGTSFGVGTAYLASNGGAVVSLEGCSSTLRIAKETIKELKLNNVKFIEGEFKSSIQEALKIIPDPELVYIDGNHTYAATISYYNQFKLTTAKNRCLVFDDIYWSKGMAKAWQEIKESSNITIDLFKIGIVLIDGSDDESHFSMFY